MRIALRALAGTVLVGTALVGCVPSSGTTPTTTAPPATTTPTTASPTTVAGPAGPVIDAFSASTTSASAPLTTALRWTIHDDNGDTLTCRLDVDGNGSTDITINNCTSDSSRTRTFTTVGTNTVLLSVSDGTTTTTSSITLTVGAAAADQYGVTLRLGGAMSPSQSTAFTTAAAKWASIVKTGQPDRPLSLPADDCLAGAPAFSGTVDDLLIDAQIVSIDGAGGILGQAGPCIVRSSNGLPLYGVMEFDSADVANLEASGQFANTIVHEMGHILGIGTVWSSPLLIGAGGSNPTFTGAAAIGTWRELGGTGNVPVENSGGAGTADSHWREAVFRTELMTGYLNSTNQLSALTVASLADLGYGVTLAGADAYTLPALRAGSVQADGVATGRMITVEPTGSA